MKENVETRSEITQSSIVDARHQLTSNIETIRRIHFLAEYLASDIRSFCRGTISPGSSTLSDADHRPSAEVNCS